MRESACDETSILSSEVYDDEASSDVCLRLRSLMVGRPPRPPGPPTTPPPAATAGRQERGQHAEGGRPEGRYASGRPGDAAGR